MTVTEFCWKPDAWHGIAEHLEGVQGTTSLYSQELRMLSGINEEPEMGVALSSGSGHRDGDTNSNGRFSGRHKSNCAIVPFIVYLHDHRRPLDRVLMKNVDDLAHANQPPIFSFLPAAVLPAIQAITNIVVKGPNTRMLALLYSAVILLCFITFRSWRAVIVALIPLVITSMLCEALMVWLGIGIKVATLPVIALGVGVGVDDALYLLSIQLTLQRRGESLADAYRQALQFTGKIVALVGLTMAAGVVTWAWSPIKFQADTGILLTFMFLWNMIGALVLIPALSYFLLPTDVVRKRGRAPVTVTPAHA